MNYRGEEFMLLSFVLSIVINESLMWQGKDNIMNILLCLKEHKKKKSDWHCILFQVGIKSKQFLAHNTPVEGVWLMACWHQHWRNWWASSPGEFGVPRHSLCIFPASAHRGPKMTPLSLLLLKKYWPIAFL